MLAIIYLIFVFVLLWFLISAKTNKKIKFLVATCALGATIFIGTDAIQTLGWPAKEVPNKFKIVSVQLDEACEFTQTKPQILLLTRVSNYKNKLFNIDSEYRLIEMEYNEENVKQAKQAQKMLKQGKEVEGKGTNQGKAGKGKPGKGNKGKSKGNGKQGGGDSESADFEAYELPPVELPEKI